MLWTEKEVKILRRYHGKETLMQIKARLPGRTYSAVKRKSRKLFSAPARKPWEFRPEEVAIIEQYRDQETLRQLVKRLPGRTYSQVKRECQLRFETVQRKPKRKPQPIENVPAVPAMLADPLMVQAVCKSWT